MAGTTNIVFPQWWRSWSAVGLYAGLPSNLTLGTRFVVPILELLLLIPVVVFNPRHLTRQTRWSRAVSVALVGVIGVANLVSLILLVQALVSRRRQRQPQAFARRPSGLAHEHHRVWPSLIGNSTAAARSSAPIYRERNYRPPTSGSPKTKTPTPWTKSPRPRRAKPTGRRC